MIFTLCERFPGVSPFTLRRERAREFFEVYVGAARYLKAEAKRKSKKQVIRKPAGDSWF